MTTPSRLQRVAIWLSLLVAAAASIATESVRCPLSTRVSFLTELDDTTPSYGERIVVTGSNQPVVSLTVSAVGPTSGGPVTIEVWVLNDVPTERTEDEVRQLVLTEGSTTETTITATQRFEYGAVTLGGPARINVEIVAVTDDCSENRFVRIDRE